MTTVNKVIMLATAVLAICLIASITFACGPCGEVAHSYLYEKNPATWEIVRGGAWGKMNYNTAGPTFDFEFNGRKLNAGGNYALIYYPDPWPGTGLVCLAEGTANAGGNIHLAGMVELNSDLPIAGDTNSPGAKIWLVLSSDVDCAGKQMLAWNLTEYLFEKDLISYHNTGSLEVLDTVDINTDTTNTNNTVVCGSRCISFNPEQSGGWGGEYGGGAVTAFMGDNDPAGYVILNVNKPKPVAVNIHHLDGLTDDSFDLYVLDAHANWIKLGHYADQGSTETWVETQFILRWDINYDRVQLAGPNILIKIDPTGLVPLWWGFDTWGQLAIDKVELLGIGSCEYD